MKQINLKEVVISKNKDQKKKAGCTKKFFNIIYYIILFFAILMVTFLLIFKKDSEGVVIFALKIITYMIILKVFIAVLGKVISKVFVSNIHTGAVRVRIEKATLINKHDELEYSYVPNTERSKVMCYMNFVTETREFTLRVGYDIYGKFNIGDEVYIIKLDDKNYGDLIYRTSEYRLDPTALSALNDEIIVNI